MNGSRESWTGEERISVETELEKLFILQDKRLTEEHKSLILEQLEREGLPAKAVVSGIGKLKLENMRDIKAFHIVSSSRTCTERQAEKAAPCENCFGSGSVSMVDDRRYGFLLACTCPNGNHYRESLVEWNGENRQYLRGRWLELRFNTLQKQPTE